MRWQVLLGLNLTSPRTEIPIGTEPSPSNLSSAPPCSSYDKTPYYDDAHPTLPAHGKCTTVSGLIVDEGTGGLWKLLTGDVHQAVYTGLHFPNSSTDELSQSFVSHCANGCLYNLKEDPLERHDLSEKMPSRLRKLHLKLEEYEATAFNPHRGSIDPLACEYAVKKYGGFWGPFLSR